MSRLRILMYAHPFMFFTGKSEVISVEEVM